MTRMRAASGEALRSVSPRVRLLTEADGLAARANTLGDEQVGGLERQVNTLQGEHGLAA